MTVGAAARAPAAGPPVWIVNADHWPRALLRAELIERGYDATGFVTVKDALLRLRLPGTPRPSLLVLDVRDQSTDETLRALLSREGVPILVIAPAGYQDGRAFGPVVGILRRPLTIGSIADAVGRALAGGR